MKKSKLKFKKFFSMSILAVILSMSFSVFAYAQTAVVVCTEDCGFNQLILQIQKIISFLLFDMAIPLAAIVFTWAGVKFMTSGENAGERSKAKSMFLNVLVGLAIAMAAWLIINTILTTLLVNPTNTQYNLLKNPN